MIKNNINKLPVQDQNISNSNNQYGDDKSVNTRSTKLNKNQKKLLKQLQQETERQRQNDFFFSDTPIKHTHIVAKIHPKLDKKYKPDCHDQICLIENLCVDTNCMAIFDGHGKCGKSVAVDLNQIFSQHMQNESRKIAWMSSQFHFEQFMTQTFQITQKKLKNSLMNYDETGASAVVVLIKKNRLFISNIGNSKAILYRKTDKKESNQMCLILTEEHVPQNIEESQRIKSKKGKIYKSINRSGKIEGPYKIWKDDYGEEPGLPITRSFGNYFSEKIGSSCLPYNNHLDLQPCDKYLIIGSDGLLNLLTPGQLCGLVNRYMEENQEFYKDGIEDYICNYCDSLIQNKKYDRNKYGFNTSAQYEDISFIIIFFGFDAKPLPFEKKTQFLSSLVNEKAILKQPIQPSLCYQQIDLKAVQNSNKPIIKELKMFDRHIKILKGSPQMAILGGMLPFGLSIMTFPVWSRTLVECTSLSDSEHDVIEFFPILSGIVGRIILGNEISKYGGKQASLFMSYLSMLGALILILASTSYEMSEVTTSSFSFYLISFGGICIGTGVANFQLVANAVFWSPIEKAGAVQGVQAGGGNLFQGVFGLIVTNLLKDTNLEIVYVITLSIMVICVVVTHIVAQDPPNMQLKRQKMEESDAKIVAEYLGQKNFATELNFQNCLKDLNCIIFIANYFIAFGGFLTMSSYIKYIILNYQKDEKIIGLNQMYIFVTLTSIARMFAGFISDKYGGYIITQISLILIFLGSVVELFTPQGNSFNVPHMIGLVCFTVAFGPMQASVYKWIVEIEYSQYTTVSTLAGTFGGFASFFINIAIIKPIEKSGEENIILGFLFFVTSSFLLLVINIWQQKIRLKQ